MVAGETFTFSFSFNQSIKMSESVDKYAMVSGEQGCVPNSYPIDFYPKDG